MTKKEGHGDEECVPLPAAAQESSGTWAPAWGNAAPGRVPDLPAAHTFRKDRFQKERARAAHAHNPGGAPNPNSDSTGPSYPGAGALHPVVKCLVWRVKTLRVQEGKRTGHNSFLY